MAATVAGCTGFFNGRASLIPKHTGIFKLHLDFKASIGTQEVVQSVKLPPGVDKNVWIASQVLGIFEEVSQIVSLLDGLCTEECCPHMNAGKDVVYSWADEKNPEPVQLSAPCYMQKLLEYAYEQLSNLPGEDEPFPSDFKGKMGTLLKRFFRVYAHAYLSHAEPIKLYEAEAHINLRFKHYLALVTEFKLVAKRDMAPLAELIGNFQMNGNRAGEHQSLFAEAVVIVERAIHAASRAPETGELGEAATHELVAQLTHLERSSTTIAATVARFIPHKCKMSEGSCVRICIEDLQALLAGLQASCTGSASVATLHQ